MPQESFHGAWEWLPSHVRQRFCQPGGSTLQDSALAASTPISAKVDLGLRMLWECAQRRETGLSLATALGLGGGLATPLG